MNGPDGIIDSHAHVDQLQDVSGSLSRAKEAGVTDIVAMSVDVASMRKTLDLAHQYPVPKIHPALGIHPGMVKAEIPPEAFDFILAEIGPAIAIGETGLDFWYKWARKDPDVQRWQKESFARHLEIAGTTGLPIVIHSRGAWQECFDMSRAAGNTKVLFHWYSGPLDILDQILSAGYFVSTSPSIALSPQSREAMSLAPLERILIETDAPVLYKDPAGEYWAEPKDVRRTLSALALLKNLDEATVLKQVNHNARTLFGF